MSIAEFPRGDRPNSTQRSVNRVPPHNLEAEASLLGAMLLSRDAVGAAFERGVRTSEFYKPAHQHIYDAIRALNTAGEPVDPVTVGDELRRNNLLEGIGGIDALLLLQNATPAITSADRYAKIVRETASLRRLLTVSAEIAEIAYSGPDDVAKAIDDSESKIFDVSESSVGDTAQTLKVLLDNAMVTLEDRAERKEAITGVATGFKDLDHLLFGLQPGTLNILGARPAMGKSALAMGIAVHVAQTSGKQVLFFSLEMGSSELVQRILSSEAGVDSKVLRSGRPTPNDWTKIGHAVGRLDVPLVIDDSPNITVGAIRAKARRTVSRQGDIGLIVIDYLQLMGGDGRPENRQLEVSEISRKLKGLAREFNIPVLALSQLTREIDRRPEKRPNLSDLRESGALEQDADVVMFLYRHEFYYPDDKESMGVAELSLAKHRAGPLGRVKLAWMGAYTRFQNYAADTGLG